MIEDIGKINSSRKIGEGRYREVYKFGDKVLKLLKPKVIRRYLGGFMELNLPVVSVTNRWGIGDFNRFEYDSYKELIGRVPKEYKKHFAKVYEAGLYESRSASVSDLVSDLVCDCPSQTLSQKGHINDVNFWNQIDNLEMMLIDKKIYLLDIRGENVMVQKQADSTIMPVLMDYKRFGPKTYPAQFLFSSEIAIVEKMQRRFDRLRENYRNDQVSS